MIVVRTTTVLATSTVTLLLLPALLFLASALYRGMGIAGGFGALIDQYAADRTNLTVITLLGLVPLLLIMLLLGIRRVIRKTWQGSAVYAVGGVIPVVAVMAFVHLQYWPSYLPNRQFLGFPHGLEFVIGPLVFAPIGVVIGCVVARLTARRSR